MDAANESRFESKFSSRLGSISQFKDSWICSPPRSSIHYAATRVRNSVIGSNYWIAGACARSLWRARCLVPGTGEAADRECSLN